MDEKISELIALIKDAFFAVTLANGISWSEAKVIDEYGSLQERKSARDNDEKNNWNEIPLGLIGDMKYQDVLPFLDARGLTFYLPACMIFTLKNYNKSKSLITHSVIYTLTRPTTVNELQGILNQKQKSCIIKFLSLCLEIGDKYFDLYETEEKLQKYWIENATISNN